VPGAAERIAGLDYPVVMDSGLVEADGDPDAGETGTDDQDFVLGRTRGDLVMVRARFSRRVPAWGTRRSGA
jgi:hypothetical protein